MNVSKTAISTSFDLGDGREITLETGKLAGQADGSVVVRMGNAMILATVVCNPVPRPGADFFPLSVDYQEKFAAAGKIPGGFLKRESRLSDYEILICRLVDRALRPMFPDDFYCDTQVMLSLISADETVMPDALAALASSAALCLTDIPFLSPISEVRVCKVDGKFIVNPTVEQKELATLDMIIAATASDVTMVEGEMHECSEAEMVEAIKIGHDAIKVQIAAQLKLAELNGGKKAFRDFDKVDENEELQKQVFDATAEKFKAVATSSSSKHERSEKVTEIKKGFIETLGEEVDDHTMFLAKRYLNKTNKKMFRQAVLDTGIRLDGRKTDEIRAIWSEVGYLPTPHGSAIFTRGETQSLTSVTLGAKTDEQMIDGAMFSGYNKFILHYNFPGFSTGEVRPNRGPGRREVGHGNLAMRALKAVLPKAEDNPYTIRVVSDILESNGSSSMATVCAGALALMDAGVKITSPVSGIAMGMISDAETGKYAILSDILGDEDYLGDMDFKVTGTEKGITACQMDIKIDGLSYEVLGEALSQAGAGRLHILNEMKKTMTEAREEVKEHAPRIVMKRVDTEFIGAIIGPGGKIIQEMQADTGTNISIEERDGYGWVQIFGNNKEGVEAAISKINAISSKPEVGETYMGKVAGIQTYGAFVEIMPGQQGLLHISEIDHHRIEDIETVLKVGDQVKVKLLAIEKGKMKLSRKVLMAKPETTEG
jgi:polyribonucleotide nucleotidyltransferase